MITNTNKNIVCVKNIPSNIIEEAIFILKNDLESSKKEKIVKMKNEIFLNESESIIKEYSLEFEKERVEKLKVKKKMLKVIIGTLVIIMFCIAVLEII